MLEIYLGRNGPQPLGTVKLQEIVDKAREVSKGHSGMQVAPPDCSCSLCSFEPFRMPFWFAVKTPSTSFMMALEPIAPAKRT